MCLVQANNAFQVHQECAAIIAATPASTKPLRTEMSCGGTQFRLDSVLTQDNIGLSVVELASNRPVVFRCLPPINHVILHIPVDGSCETLMEGSDRAVKNDPGEMMLIAPHTGRKRDVLFENQGISRFVQLTIDLPTFINLNRDLGIAVNAHKNALLHGGGARVISRKELPPALMISLNQLFSADAALMSHGMFLRAKTLEFLSIFAVAEDWKPRTKSNKDLQPAVLQRVEKAHDILMSDMENAPAIPDLAKQVMLGESTLRTAFKRHFGQPIHVYLTQKRLDRARELLMTEQWRTVSDVAFEVGLRSPGRFASMFADRFGILPSTLKEAQTVS